MQNAFNVVSQFSPVVTSVRHGGHAKGSAHYDGRAVDVGAFGGTTVGYNEPTWNAIIAAIQSRQFSRIGTVDKLYRNPTLQAYARANGVLLFFDPGSGPHVHFQVGQ